MFELVAFAVAAGCLLGLSGLMVVSLLAPERRLWPAGDDDGKRRVYLALSRPLLPAVFATGVLDWSAGPLAAPWHLGVGAVGVLAAFAVLNKSAVDLGEAATEGREDELRTDGLYRYTRNPQNVGYVLLFATYAVLANSPLVGVLRKPGSATLTATPTTPTASASLDSSASGRSPARSKTTPRRE